MQEFLSFVAALFKVSADTLSLETAYQSIPEWDSMMQIRLVMELEEQYDIEIPLEMVPEINTLALFYQFITREGSA